MLRERVRAEIADLGMFVPPPASDEQLGRVHTEAYLRDVVEGSLSSLEVRRIGFPWSPKLVERSRRSAGGTIAAARAALTDGVAANLAGGTHHAFADRGEGFCVFNDVAVAARAMQSEEGVQRVAIIDLDVHQGNGTASVFSDDSSVQTISVHGESNFPFRKEESDLDIALPDGTGDQEFLAAVTKALVAVEDLEPELVLYVAGADPFEDDRLGRLSVTKAGLLERDERVVHHCATADIPLAVVMSGGYARNVADTVDIHFNSIRTLALQAEKRP